MERPHILELPLTATASKMNSWSANDNNDDDDDTYQCLVVDSGPIIRLASSSSSASSLWRQARLFYTVPGVLQEIRDAKARQHLEQLPFDLRIRPASREGVHAVTEFARQTGDYHSLSAVDLQVLGLLYDLERESCGGDVSHIRTAPKRTLGLGQMEVLGKKGDTTQPQQQQQQQPQPQTVVDGKECCIVVEGEGEEVEEEEDKKPATLQSTPAHPSQIEESTILNKAEPSPQTAARTSKAQPNSWAALLNPHQSSTATTKELETLTPTTILTAPVIKDSASTVPDEETTKHTTTRVTFATAESEESVCSSSEAGGQFSDAESDDDDDFEISESFSDEECEAYVLDPGEKEQVVQKRGKEEDVTLERELQSDFPSLAAGLSVAVGEEGSDVDSEEEEEEEDEPRNEEPGQADIDAEAEEERKRRSLQPISKSGKLYNSFTKYGDLMKPKPKKKPATKQQQQQTVDPASVQPLTAKLDSRADATNQSRIIGGMSFAGQGDDVEDDGEGWITCTKDIRTIKAAGTLDPSRNPSNLDKNAAGGAQNKPLNAPPNSQRAACTTTDFAMQNVILQMNLELLSVDGMKIRKLKNWVTRCGACFTVYTNADSRNTGPLDKRLFCDHCGSDMMQRIAASVDGKTGRLRLHLSKKYKHNLRGTKFSLPKPGSGNRFQGDLLLREDQLMMGAWNQKVKMRSGGKAKDAAQSMFGRDIASNVGCHANALTSDDIRVGFGRRNPNAAKGRERRGKKKKSSDKACGLRRY